MIVIDRVSFRYRGSERDSLRTICFKAAAGEFIGITGPSGAGKTTLGYAINGIVPRRFPGDFFGELRVKGLDTIETGPEILARHVGNVLQDIDGQMLSSTVEDEILFGLENFGFSPEEIEERLESALAQAGIAGLRDRALSSLSGGQKQKTAIAAVTALRPSILLLDEPTGELDPLSSRRVFEYLKKLNQEQGITIIVIEQKIALLCEFVDRLAVMDRGELILEGDAAGVLRRGERLEAAGVDIPRISTLAEKLRQAGLYRGDPPVNLAQAEAMVRQVCPAGILGADCGVKPGNPGGGPGDPAGGPADSSRAGGSPKEALRFDRVSFAYTKNGPPLLQDISFRLMAGEFAVLLGENGAGKSTLARLCNGLLRPLSGAVIAAGMDTRRTKTSVLARRTGFLFQNPDRQICRSTVREEILFGLQNIFPGEREEREKRCKEMLERFSLPGEREPFGMSRGERQRIALASALALKPELLILDEPSTGLDYRECTLVMGALAELNREGTAVLMITHDMEAACDYARRALILSGGRLAADCSVREAMKNRALLAPASLLPAQIPALALALGPVFEGVYTVDEMVEAIHDRIA
ncbi:MAG: ATP-binding cassette domain-containing protein [Treponema sp.]|jgi:energy-coupling factor transport system ATP-binding protein|nr:ATP-binding cassette domain-containing protein [Treponema sp.]